MSINKKIILDVRTAEEFSQGSIPGSINIPLQDLQQNINVLPKDGHVTVVCESGGRAMMAEMILKQQGFSNVECGGSWRTL